MKSRIQWLGILVTLTWSFASNPDYVTTAGVANIEPVIDGHIINDPAWETVPEINTFTQKSPDEGEAVTERTVVKVMYSTHILYIAAVCYDTNPEKIVITDTRRDAPLNNTDSFMFILDTFQDQQNGYVFGTNVGGIEYDAQVSGEGEGITISSSRMTVGTGSGYNVNWDAVWEVRTSLGEFGWSAEFAIPFKTLRYATAKDQEWGVNFQRVIARKKEQVFWAPIPRQFSLSRLVNAGSITGINVPNPRNLKIMPYGLGQNNNIATGEESFSSTNTDFGMDGKLSLTSSLVLDMTYNTDFAQVEADEQQINLDRFSLFFPEKRAFFLENAGLFSVGENTFRGPDVAMFFSRRIGISNENQVPIIVGGRLTGTLGGMKVGALNMQTKAVEDVTEGDNYSVLRMKKELPNRTYIGAIITDLNHLGESGYHNRAYAIDGQLGIGKLNQIVGYYAQSETPELDKDKAYAYRLALSRNTQAFSSSISFSEIGESFNPEMGFVKRQGGYKKFSARIFNRTRPKDLWGLLELRPHINYDGYWQHDGFQQSGRWHVDNHWAFRSGFEIHTGMNFTKEGIQEEFSLSDITVPAATYNHSEAQIFVSTNQTKTLSFSMMSRFGGYFGGSKKNFDTSIKYRFGDRFTSELASNYNDVGLVNGRFVAHLIRVRLTYAFSPSMYIQSLAQYNNQSDEWSMNWRFIWQQSAATGLYLVYNQTQDYDGIPIKSSTKSFVMKYSYLFDAFK